MDITALAPLVSLLPDIAKFIVTKTSDTVIGEAAKKLFGEATTDGKAFVEKYLFKVIDDEEAVKAAEAVINKPESEPRKSVLQEELARVLAAHPSLLEEFKQLQPGNTVIQSGNRNVNIGSDNSGTVITGDNNTFGK